MELLGVIGLSEMIIILFIAIPLFLLPIVAIVDIIKSKFKGNMQLIWILIIVFFNVIGSILYFIIGRNQKIQR